MDELKSAESIDQCSINRGLAMGNPDMASTLFVLAALWIVGGAINVVYTEDVIRTTKSTFEHLPFKPVEMTPSGVRGFGYLGIALGVISTVVGVLQLITS